MALNNNQRDESKPDLEELESDVKRMAEKIVEYRSTIPDQLKITIDSVFSSQRLNLSSINDGLVAGPSREDLEDMELSRKEEKIQLLEEKLSSNISAIPDVVERMKECISKLDSCRYHTSTFQEKKN